jgi:hypothetical protein
MSLSRSDAASAISSARMLTERVAITRLSKWRA